MAMTVVAVGIVAGSSLVVAAPAPASIERQPTKNPQQLSRSKQVRELHDKAFEHYDAKRFSQAAAYFEEAAKLEPSPELLWNAARAHDRAGQHNEAVAWYQQFLNQATEPEQQLATARARVAILTMQLSEPTGFTAPRWPGWVAIAAGAALTVGGVLMTTSASDRHSALTSPIDRVGNVSRHPTLSYRQVRQRANDIRETQDGGVALLTVGVGLVVGGTAWVLAPRADDQAQQPAAASVVDVPAGAR